MASRATPESWLVVVAPSAVRALERLPEKVATAIVEFVTGTLPRDPVRLSKPLRYELEGWRVARRGAYRVTFQLEPHSRRLLVGRIEHRRDVYRPR